MEPQMKRAAMQDSTADAIFSLDHVEVVYHGLQGRRPVLKDVDLTLRPGETVGLYGPNGSGKTTLFRCITGLVRPRSGVIRLHGEVVDDEKALRALRRTVGFVLQNSDDQLFFPTVLEDVAFGPLNLGMSPGEARERALQTLKELGLAGFEKRLTHRLSGGEKRLAALAGVLAMRPEALLLDEPTTGLDEASRARLIHVLKHLKTARITVSHDWDFLTQVSSRFLTIEDGRLTAFSPSIAHAHMHAHPLGAVPHTH